MSYKIVRNYLDQDRAPRRRTVVRGLTLEEARVWCSDPETSSKTAVSAASKRRTKLYGPWFDGYDEE